jgi:SAM-dependent methyltransferase
MLQTADDILEFTGERLVPERCEPHMFAEHAERYRFAARYVKGLAVVDIACGEGYGSAALKHAGASSVIGLDISEETCAYARKRHGIDARVGDAERIPLPDASADVVVSFETIEHVPHPDHFVRECRRILRSNGTLIMSTPNREVYRELVPDHNPFHCSELSLPEFRRLLDGEFASVRVYGQHPVDPWYLRVRGTRRYLRQLRQALIPGLPMDMNHSEPLRTTEAILSKRGPLERWLNVAAVQTFSDERLAKAKFLVAVARPRGATQA